MAYPSRRSVLRGTVGLAAAGALARPYLANAAATTVTVWWPQGFIPEEDAALKASVADYQKSTGDTVDLSITPFAALRQKEISAMTTGVTPDVIAVGDFYFGVLNAWKDQLVDVTDIIETQKAEYSQTALHSVYSYNNTTKKRSYYMVPGAIAYISFHIWKPLVEKAGFKIADLPKTWDAFLDFFEPVQTKLRTLGMRNVYAHGYQLTANGVDPINTFAHFLIAYGGKDIVTSDGKLHTKDPQVREAAAKAIVKLTTPYKNGFVPPAVTNWNDADDNNAFHAKLIVMDFDGTISTEVALWHDKAEYDSIEVRGLPLSNDGKELPSIATPGAPMIIPKTAKNITAAKEFIKYQIQPKVLGARLKGGLGRNVPSMPSIVKNDPGFWLDPKNQPLHAYTTQGVLNPTIPSYEVFNPAMAQVNTEHVFSVAMFDVMNKGMAPEAAVDKAFKRCEAIFANYPIQEG